MIDKELFVEYQKRFGKWYDFRWSSLMTDEEVNDQIQACISSGFDQHDYRFKYDEKEAEEAIESRDLVKLQNCYYKRYKTEYIMSFYTRNEEWMIDELIECLKNNKVSANLPWKEDPYNLEWMIPPAYRSRNDIQSSNEKIR